jgi:glutaredoxin
MFINLIFLISQLTTIRCGLQKEDIQQVVCLLNNKKRVKMDYELYTVPRCDQCEKVKEFLNEKSVSYEVYNLREIEHKKIFGKIYLGIASKLKKNVQNQTILPLLVGKKDGKVEQIAQQFDEIKNLFN